MSVALLMVQAPALALKTLTVAVTCATRRLTILIAVAMDVSFLA
jgi:hypothetical protein